MYISETHEWVRIEGKKGIVGISSEAASHIGEIVYIELPAKGSHVKAKEIACVLESSKSASDVYSPVSGTVCAVNESVKKDPSLINSSPEKEGWLFQVELHNLSELEDLLPFNQRTI
jgi:glycine cleavage system H protein